MKMLVVIFAIRVAAIYRSGKLGGNAEEEGKKWRRNFDEV